jgi:hypothetical protein
MFTNFRNSTYTARKKQTKQTEYKTKQNKTREKINSVKGEKL